MHEIPSNTIPFNITRRVQFAETDMAGVLHFSNYYRWMEEIEHAFWRSCGLSVIIDTGEISWPRVKTGCEHYAPARFEDEVLLTLRVINVGDQNRSSFRTVTLPKLDTIHSVVRGEENSTANTRELNKRQASRTPRADVLHDFRARRCSIRLP